MANLVPQNEWSDVRQLEKTDVAIAGAGGTMNEQAQALLNRTEVLRNASGILDASGKTQQDINDITVQSVPLNSVSTETKVNNKTVLSKEVGFLMYNQTSDDWNVINTGETKSVFEFFTLAELVGHNANPSTFNVTRPFQAAFDSADVFTLFIPDGTYLISGLVLNKNNFTLFGNGFARAILTMDNSAAFAITYATTSSSYSGLNIRGLKLQGNVNNLGGVKLGDATHYAAFTNISKVQTDGFTGANACDYYLGSVQELELNNIHSWNGNIGIYRPNSGYGTSTQITGKSGYIGRHAKHAIKLDGQIDDIYLQDSVVEANGLEAVYINDTAFKGTQGVTFNIQNAYFESNGNSGAGAGVVYIKGAVDYLKLHRVYSHGCNFAANPNAPVDFKNFAGKYTMLCISGSSNLLPGSIGITNSFIEYRANLTVSAADILQQLKDLNALTGNYVAASGFNYLRAYQNNKNIQANMFSSITFPSVNVVSTDPNTLDDYEEADYTPVITGNGGAYTTVTGKYTKIGNLVTFFISIVCQNFTSTWGTTKVSLPLGNMTIGGSCSFVNNQNGVGGQCMLASGQVNLPTLASQGSVATLFISGSYQTTL